MHYNVNVRIHQAVADNCPDRGEENLSRLDPMDGILDMLPSSFSVKYSKCLSMYLARVVYHERTPALQYHCPLVIRTVLRSCLLLILHR